MKIAFISDIHANLIGLQTVLKDLQNVNMIFCAGDITGYYPFPNEVIDLLKSRKVICVKGNHDEYLLKGKTPIEANEKVKESVKFTKRIISENSLNFLKRLPKKIEIEVDGKKVLICHGSPWDLLEERVYPDYPNLERFEELDSDIIVLGHTHYPFIKKFGEKTIINPGSCGQPRDFNLLSFCIWDTNLNNFEIKRVTWDIEKFKEEALARGTSPELFEVFNRMK